MPRSEAFLLAMLVAVPAAMANRVGTAVLRDGFWPAFAGTFDVSAVVWLSLAVAAAALARPSPARADRWDGAALALAVAGALLPLGAGLWAVVGLIAAALLMRRDLSEAERTAGSILLSASFCLFWSRRLFDLVGPTVLAGDAVLVAMVTGTARVGNMVALPGGGGFLQIQTGCSSLANVAVGLLGWTTWCRLAGLRLTVFTAVWAGVVSAGIVAVNVSRIALIGFLPERYDLLHGPAGQAATSWTATALLLALCIAGERHARRA